MSFSPTIPKIPSISDALRKVVQKVDADLSTDSTVNFDNGMPNRVFFEHGTDEDIIKLLAEYTKAGRGKYPLIALIRKPSIPQTLSRETSGYKTAATVRIIICTITKPSYRPDEREVKSFKNILHPIFEKLIKHLSASIDFGQPDVSEMKIIFSDNYSWGKLQMQEVGDYIDAVDISRISIAVSDTTCINNIINS